MTTNTAQADTSTSIATTKTRKPRAPSLTLGQKFELQTFVKSSPSTTPDSTLAKQASANFGRLVRRVTITDYRGAMGIDHVPRPSYADLETRIEELENLIGKLDVHYSLLAENRVSARLQPTTDRDLISDEMVAAVDDQLDWPSLVNCKDA